MAPPWGKLLFILCIRSTKQLYVIASVIKKKKDNNIGEKDYVILLFIFQVRFHEKRHDVVCDSRRLFQLYFTF